MGGLTIIIRMVPAFGSRYDVIYCHITFKVLSAYSTEVVVTAQKLALTNVFDIPAAYFSLSGHSPISTIGYLTFDASCY